MAEETFTRLLQAASQESSWLMGNEPVVKAPQEEPPADSVSGAVTQSTTASSPTRSPQTVGSSSPSLHGPASDDAMDARAFMAGMVSSGSWRFSLRWQWRIHDGLSTFACEEGEEEYRDWNAVGELTLPESVLDDMGRQVSAAWQQADPEDGWSSMFDSEESTTPTSVADTTHSDSDL